MLLAELQGHGAYQALEESEREEVDKLVSDGLVLDAVAVDNIDGKPSTLTVEDLRSWLATARSEPYALLGVEETLPDAGRFLQTLLSEVDISKKPERIGTIVRLRSLAGLVSVAEQGRRANGFTPDEQLAAIAQQVENVSRDVELPASTVHAALRKTGLGVVSETVGDYYDSTTGFRGWLIGAVRSLDTAVENSLQGLLTVFTGSPDHEGRFDGTAWSNWSDEYAVEPENYITPKTEAELCAAVRDHDKVRVVGGGHSFNDSPLSTGALISLDKYASAKIEVGGDRPTAKVQGGIRLRDLNKALAAAGLALPVLGSTDAQSIAGLVCTDLHGTGRDHGFLSEQVLSLRIIDAEGVACTVKRGDPLFHAAIGGIGALGVVAEVELELVPAFNLRKTVRMVDRAWAEEHIDELLSRRDHLSFYYAGGAAETRTVRMHTWDRTDEPPDQDWQKKMADAELGDFILSGFVPGAIELLASQNADALWIQPFIAEKSFVALAGRAFGRRLFYRHDEIEYGLPYECYRTVLDEVMKLLSERNYFSIVEVRFTPNTSQALIGPGVGRRTAYIELATPLSQATGDIYAEVEDIFRKHHGQPHLGKKTNVNSEEMLKIYGKDFAEFAELRAKQDPKGKFKNRFIEQVF